ncbi:TonB-dependent receptor [Croceivirga sp. JEA036]|uniref:TonB-dependent receptor n=1 Tax=Croceivirga sp. JEA036 TaxID=2721162 RepID=UPI00143AD938|nr:TonB-dependent receptor [Croceivirga sp. JEA036]NJB36665.1 TonB-dependent receptor [Croceivirga sp. JEA036]
MKNTYWLFAILLLILNFGHAQDKVEGMIMEGNAAGKHLALPGANVYWLNSPIGTITNKDGLFAIPYTGEYDKLVVSYIGFKTDTLTITEPKMVQHTLQPSNQLDEVVVEQKRESLQKTYFSPQNVVTVNSAELLKAACCNLAESFETNPSIDVNISDAITGTKQIQMLGLTSPYLLITQENIPMVRGASQAFGLTFTPGTWIESIQITKGAGSVVNGYESISGQINAEIVKPFTDKKLFVNGYANENGRYELNTHFNHKLNAKWSTGLYVHANKRSQIEEENGDGFLDAPLSDQINVMNRWQFQDAEKGWVSFLNIRFLTDNKQLGALDFNPDTDKFTINAWGAEIDTKRLDGSLKIGYVFPELPFQSLGFQASYSKHQQDSYFGLRDYFIDHESIYGNMLFSSIIGDTQHKFKTGVTFAYDGYEEIALALDYSRNDVSGGAFLEYAFDNMERLSLTAGVRVDTHNRLGTFITPRFHLRYTPWERASLKGSFGRGKRAANIFAENQQLFATARTINILNAGGEVYGLNPEDAWNYGLSFLQGFTFLGRPGEFNVDLYRTDFRDKVVVDWETAGEINFYNLEGKSVGTSLQIELNHRILPQTEVRTAYKYYDVRTDYRSGSLQQPLQAQHRFFANLGYETKVKENGSQWKMDYTVHIYGKQRLPSAIVNGAPLDDFAGGYSHMNAQLTKVFSPSVEFYVGGENLSNVKQENPVLGANDPFGPNFDTSIVYAPIMGRMFYAGFRYKLN